VCPDRSDHIPVTTHLDIRLATQIEPPWLNFKATDWKEFRKVLLARLKSLETQDDIPNEALLLSHIDSHMCHYRNNRCLHPEMQISAPSEMLVVSRTYGQTLGSMQTGMEGVQQADRTRGPNPHCPQGG